MNLSQRFNATAKWLHWIIALGIVYTFGIGWIMTSMTGISPTKIKYFNWHKWAGVTVFAIAVIRILWRIAYRPDPLRASISAAHRRASEAMHYLLYVATILVPVTGYLYSLATGYPVVYLGLFPLPVLFGRDTYWAEILRTSHSWSSYAMAVAVLFHAGAAFLHHFYYRDGVLLDMLPRRSSSLLAEKERPS